VQKHQPSLWKNPKAWLMLFDLRTIYLQVDSKLQLLHHQFKGFLLPACQHAQEVNPLWNRWQIQPLRPDTSLQINIQQASSSKIQ
jgi:hypothetical protein